MCSFGLPLFPADHKHETRSISTTRRMQHAVNHPLFSQAAVDHLISIGFLSRADVARAGGLNLLWGLLLQVRGAGGSTQRLRTMQAEQERPLHPLHHVIKVLP